MIMNKIKAPLPRGFLFSAHVGVFYSGFTNLGCRDGNSNNTYKDQKKLIFRLKDFALSGLCQEYVYLSMGFAHR